MFTHLAIPRVYSQKGDVEFNSNQHDPSNTTSGPLIVGLFLIVVCVYVCIWL